MKYIQDETTTALYLYSIGAVILGYLTVKWDIYESKQYDKKGEYREIISKIRLRGIILILLIGLYATVKELVNRL